MKEECPVGKFQTKASGRKINLKKDFPGGKVSKKKCPVGKYCMEITDRKFSPENI